MAADLELDTPVLVAPTTSNEFNAVRERLVPVASWQVDDFWFDFDSSFLNPDVVKQFVILADMRADHAGAPLALFGHADPVGDDELNKTLSGRRATAVYAVLTRRVDLWQHLYDNPQSGDTWGTAARNSMCAALGRPTDPPPAHAGLFRDYMDLICRDRNDQPYTLDPKQDFLARGADPHGKGDYQGCSEFNPLILFSADDASRFADKSLKAERDLANAPNRRVTGLLLTANTSVDPAHWPCPRATEGTAGCKKRFWSDAATRRKNGAVQRTNEVQGDTFACRFYERIAHDVIGPGWIHIRLQLHDPTFAPCEDAEFTLTLASGAKRTGRSGADGLVSIAVPPDPQVAMLTYTPKDSGVEYAVAVEILAPTATRDDRYLALLHNLGFQELDGDVGAMIQRFQAAHGALDLSGQLDDATRKAIDAMLEQPLKKTLDPTDG